MNKAVLISIQPKWCELIVRGEKTIETRKTKPKLDVPFKVYIYETKGKTEIPSFIDEDGHEIYQGRGQVIGEFMCFHIGKMSWLTNPSRLDWIDSYDADTCLTNREIYEYSKGDKFYEWYITKLKVYDKPKELGEFIKPCDTPFQCDKCKELVEHFGCGRTMTRPPQSWCYVESKE